MRALLLLSALLPLAAQDWYVSGTGADGNAGTAPASAFRTLQKAAGLVNPGDTVWVMDGVYTNGWPTGDALQLTRSGTAAAWITWRAMPGHAPEIRFTGWNGIKVAASYQIIDGFTITGPNDAITLAQAEADALNATPNPLYNGTGITIDGRSVTAKYHHITIRDCLIRKCSGGGISAIQSDYITIEDCRITETAWYGRYAQSGISLWQCWNADDGAGYRNVIRRNTVWNNRSLVPWVAVGRLSDGNGIIFDDSKNTQNGSTLGPYAGRTLISDNLAVNNGGSGIHAYLSEHVDIVNNTAWRNGQVVGYPEIFANSCNDVRILDNIMVARTGGDATANHANTAVTYDWNIYWNGPAAVVGPNDRVLDPRLVAPGTDLAVADFRLRADSPARDTGTVITGVTSTRDRAGVARPQGSGIDRGAYEYLNAAPVVTAAAATPGVLVLP